jgi:regulator of sigma E protease
VLVVIGFILIILLVIAHEAGHFFAARRNGIEVEEFGVGFPPKAKTIAKKNGTEYTLNWLPLGGFVKLKGEHDADTEPGSFGAASLKAKIKVMVAGVGMNFLIAYLLFTVIALIGMPILVDNQFSVASNATTMRQDVLAGYVEPESPGAIGGLEVNDTIVSISESGDCTECRTFVLTDSEQLGQATSSLAGEAVSIEVVRGDESLTLSTTLLDEKTVAESKETDDPKGYLGVVPTEFRSERYTWAAPIVGAGLTVQFTELTFKGLWNIVTGLLQGDTATATEQVSGVVGVGYIFSSASFLGPVFMLMIVAVISLSLAIMNILPIPALDGGRLFVTLLYKVMRKPLTQQTEERIHGTGFALLMVLFMLITIVDVNRFIL